MKYRISVCLHLLVGVFVCLGVAGCGAKTVKVHGKLTYGSTALKGKDHEPIVVEFCPYNDKDEEDGPACRAEVDQDSGTYEVVVPTGRHRVCICCYQEDLSDKFQGVFAPGQSPIIRDIQSSSEINLDLQQLKQEAGPGGVPGTVSTAMPP
ncbi:MAG TPA: hypothetical protein VH575_26925 [Gemmataceae bacterium]|jgi:hypothetical protein